MSTLVATDRDAFLGLVDEHGAPALAMLRRLCGNPHDADDVFQEVAVRVWRHLDARPRLRNARAWLMTIAYRAFLDHRARRPAHAPLTGDEPSGWDDPGTLAEAAEGRRSVHDAVAALPESLREVVALHYTGGLTLRQVAEATGLPSGTVKSRLNAGLEHLRRRLS